LWQVAGGYLWPTDVGTVFLQLWKAESGTYEREFEVVRLLLKCGANVNRRGGGGLTALHVAVRQAIHLGEKPPMVDMLLANGADMDLTDEDGSTPLHYAAAPSEIGVADVIKALLQHGAAIDAADKNGLTPLHITARNEALEASNDLTDHGADCCALSRVGITPLTNDVINSHQGIVELMLRHNGPSILKDALGWGPLRSSATQFDSRLFITQAPG
jgi:ankyrin repeat protein